MNTVRVLATVHPGDDITHTTKEGLVGSAPPTIEVRMTDAEFETLVNRIVRYASECESRREREDGKIRRQIEALQMRLGE